ncbi:MAG TPA: HEAT repeat domain-containing protein [Solirubrobacterales bacterium]|nr:HEAT repeat domain-containing protein [Solirubrobacterales bacterium]
MALTVAMAFGVLLAVLVCSVLARKANRDVAESRSRERRERIVAGLADGDTGPLEGALAGTRHPQEDAIAVLRANPGAGPAGLSPPEPLVRQLRSRSAPARGRAVVLLGLLGAEESSAAVAALLADENHDVRLAAATALEQIGGATGAAALVDALETELLSPSRVVERIAHPWAVEALLPERGRFGTLARTSLWRAAGLAQAEEAVPVLREVAREGEDEERISAVRALGELGSEEAADDLLAALADPLWQVRAQAATALGRLGDQAAVADLEHAMADQSWWVRTNAAIALGQLGEEGAAALERVAGGRDPYAAERAREALQGVAA